ncbi:MAG: glycosyltransferase [Aquihabitans sp.]
MNAHGGRPGGSAAARAVPLAVAAAPDLISVVIPVLNGEGLIDHAHRSITRSLDAIGTPYELVFVDDGSTDGTWAALQSLVEHDRRARAVRLADNVGQAGATAAGIDTSRGSVVVTIDVDLETDPDDLGLLLDALDQGSPLASGRRTSRRAWAREVPSRTFNAYARCRGIPLRDIGCGTNAMRRDIAVAYASVPDLRRELPSAVFDQLTDDIVEVDMRSRRPDGSQISARQLVMLWVAFERRRGHPQAGAALVAGAGAGALVASAAGPAWLARPTKIIGTGLVVVAAIWRLLDRMLDVGGRAHAPVVVEVLSPPS